MPLSGDQFKRIQEALLDAYDEPSLRRMVRTRLDITLDHVAGGGNLSEIVFNLIGWAERTGNVQALIDAATVDNPGNPALQALAKTVQGQPTSPSAKQSGPAAGSGGDTFHVHIGDNATNVVVGKDIVQTVGGRQHTESNRRDAELAYLTDLIRRYEFWAEKYTPLAGIAEVRAATVDGPRLDLPTLFMPTGFEKLVEHGFGPQRRSSAAVDDLLTAFQQQRLVVLGEPGSGKTTTLWRLVYDLAAAATEDPDAPLPLLAPLGGYTGMQSPLDYAAGFFGDLGPQLADYLRRGRVVLLLDALNEMPQRGYRERVGRIQSLLDSHEELSVVVTCRALDYVEELALEKLAIKPLDVIRQRDYLHRYLGEADGERLFWQLAGNDEIAALWQTWQAAAGSFQDFWTAEKMPDEVYQRTSMRARSSLENVACRSTASNAGTGRQPVHAGHVGPGLCRQAAAAPEPGQALRRLCGDPAGARGASGVTTPATIGPVQNPSVAGWRRWPTPCRKQASAALRWIGGGPWPSWSEIPCPANDLLYNAAGATLLDINDGSVRFVHQLVQEYFAALGWLEKLPGDDLSRYWPDGWLTPSGWEETAILLAGILDDMTPLVTALIPVNPVLAARCIDESGGPRPADRTVHLLRTGLAELATGVVAPAKQRGAAGDALNLVGDLRPGVGVKHGLPDIDWVTIEPGPFVMGSDKAVDKDAWDAEAPQFTCDLIARPYRIARYPVTVVQFNTFVEAGGYRQPRFWTEGGWTWLRDRKTAGPATFGEVYELANHPQVGVSWYEAMAFCAWLSEQAGCPITLPSEAQWERAARGTDGRFYPWGNEFDAERCNSGETRIGTTSAVGIFAAGASLSGCLDMSGNVFEWCSTQWLNSYENYGNRVNDDPAGSAGRVVRGGAFSDNQGCVRCADRPRALSRRPAQRLGFRVVAPGL